MMKLDFLSEPELEFGVSRHIDIRFGLMNYGPFDVESELAPREIKVGFVGTAATIEGARTWLERCGQGITAKKSKQPNLFPRFPGFSTETGFRASFVTSTQLQQPIRQRDLDALGKHTNPDRIVADAVDLFMAELTHLSENPSVEVLLCAVPMDLLEMMQSDRAVEANEEQGDENGEDELIRLNFRHMLKASAMNLRKPIQLILPPTYDETKKLKPKRPTDKPRRLQDEATRAWNFHTAMYYKAGGTPWRLVRDTAQLATCYIGISFYRSLDGKRLLTSMAQVFNERGDGIIVRGGAAKQTKEDRRPYLEADDAYSLLNESLKRYRAEHRTLPARVVLHKSSPFTPGELEGFRRASDDHNIDTADFLSMRKAPTRLFRNGQYPPLRGTFLSLDERSHVLYTRGSVDFFETYPGLYVPTPLRFHCDATEQSPRFLAQEILALTKMNWNDTQFDGSLPITLGAADHVGDVLKYIGEHDPVEPRYSYYM